MRSSTNSSPTMGSNLHPNIRLLTWFNFCTDFRLYSAIAILYFQQVTGSFALGMSIFSITMVSSALLEIPTGVFSDRIGRRKTIILGAAAAVVYALLYAIASVYGGYWMLAAGAVFEGLSRSLYSGNNNALLHDTLAQTQQEEEFAEMLGKTSAMFQLALGISAVLGSFLAEWSFPLIMWLSVLPQVFCLIIAFFIQEPTVHVERHAGNVYEHLREALREFRTNRKLRLLTISSAWSYAFGEAAYQFISAIYNLVWPVWIIGVAKGATNIMASVSYHFAGRIIKRFGAVPILITGNIYNRIVEIVGGLWPNPVTLPLMTTTALWFGTATVAQGALLQKEFKPAVRASMASLSAFVGSLLFGIVSFGVGMVADTVSPQTAFVGLQVFLAVVIWWQWRLLGR